MMGMYGFPVIGGGWLYGVPAAVVVVLAAVLLMRLLSRRPHSGHHPAVDRNAGSSTAIQILEERYARGEIRAEEYQERLKTLGSP
ncbi:SHOCT domain-containing protein [Leifsonia sp. 22587]|uniref:SHOCT domain-containing protein n=1 Tax=Leifsonia sp. 22587 TaxID=3453946 RepID=UPI003F82BAB5